MAVPVVAAAGTPATDDGADSTIVVPTPAGVTSGDVLYTVASHDTGSAVSVYNTPSGWTLEDEIHGATAGCTVYLFSRRADGSEGASVSLTMNGSRFMNAVCLRVTGVDTGIADLTHQYNEADNASSTSQTSPSITTTEADCLTLSAFVTDNTAADSMAPAGSETEVADFQNPGFNGMVMGVYRLAKATPGSVTHSVTLNGAAPCVSIIWAIQAGAVVGGGTGGARMLMGVG